MKRILRRYAKGIAAALGSVIAVGAGVALGWDPEAINTKSVTIAGALQVLITTFAVVGGPAND